MENDISQQIEKRLAELPEDVRNAVLSVEWEQKVQAIAQKHALHIDQSGALGDTTLMAMLGFFNMADFATHITQEVGVSADAASAIATEVSNEVFMPIRDSLHKFVEAASKPEVAPAPEAPAAVKLAPAPQPKPDLSAAEVMLQGKTLSTPPVTTPIAPIAPAASTPAIKEEPPKPANYAADPYREPPM